MEHGVRNFCRWGPAVLGRNSGFGALLRADALHAVIMHCALHECGSINTLASRTGQIVQKFVIEKVNYFQSSVVNHCIIAELCSATGNDFEVHLHSLIFGGYYEGRSSKTLLINSYFNY